MDKNKLISQFLIMGIGTAISIGLSVISTPVITRLVDPFQYGEYSIFTMYINIALMVLCLGMDQALVRYFYDRDQLQYKTSLLKLCFVVPVTIALFVSSIFLLLCYYKIIRYEFSMTITFLLCINVVLCIWNRISTLLLRTIYDSKSYSISNILYKIIFILLSLILIAFYHQDGLISLVIATTLAYVFQAIYATISGKKYWKLCGQTYPSNSLEIIRYGLPFILSMGLTTVFQALDKLSLNYYCTYSDVGVFSSAMSIVNIFALIQTTFNALWGPLQVEYYVKHPDDPSVIKKVNKYITVIMFVFGITLIMGKDIFALLLGDDFREASSILPFLIFNPIMYTISETTCCGIGISKKSYLNIYVSLIACCTNLIGNMSLVPPLGPRGAAISTGLSYIVFFLSRTYFSNINHYINYQLKKIYILITLAVLYALYNTFYDNLLVSAFGFILIICVIIKLYTEEIKEIIHMLINFLEKHLYRIRGNKNA
ncbi:lipopolysaccharide biosynthesis protein [Faecalibaculum rodentium]|uniref:lipopolysaccharide biosynthesis protein n=1 Tax=Faecalibaculum rodentium TaxID=1702221 RepID=UPI0023F1F685|nr:lipopolysaccharide biosynthesis protein [Faecalibaculum rodentium]